MTQPSDPYAQWLRSIHTPAHARRTAERNATFLLPHLKSGQRLLDVGCGPGSITVGLARAVAPGEVVGIDINADVVAAATALAHQLDVQNARFSVENAHSLSFGAGAFDVAFMHAILQHLEEPAAAITEVRRVLRPGGLIALADADFGGHVIAPRTPRARCRNRAPGAHSPRRRRRYTHRCAPWHAAGERRLRADRGIGCGKRGWNRATPQPWPPSSTPVTSKRPSYGPGPCPPAGRPMANWLKRRLRGASGGALPAHSRRRSGARRWAGSPCERRPQAAQRNSYSRTGSSSPLIADSPRSARRKPLPATSSRTTFETSTSPPSAMPAMRSAAMTAAP